MAAELFTGVNHTLERLDVEEASKISRNACVSPCSLILALLYLEKLKDCNPEYLQQVAPSKLFLVSLVCFVLFCSLSLYIYIYNADIMHKFLILYIDYFIFV